jgi:Ca-activated chloride channel homolog
MVVLDASGSMKQADAPGPRIDAAKRAVTGLVAALPQGARVGLTVYGTGTGSGAADKAAGCRDIKQLIPVQQVDRSAFDAAVGRIRASGYTPIGRSLQQAAAALPAEGPRSVVLVSDGEDTCAPPDPCQVAKQLKAAGTDLVVHTIGFKVGAAARAQLSCIASATGGTYREATSGASLGAVLTNRVERALKPYTAVGTPIQGGATPADAPGIEPGQYLDTYARGGRGPGDAGTTKFYALRLREGESPYVSATLIPPGVRSENITAFVVSVTFVDAAGDDCAGTSAWSSEVAVFGKVPPQTAVAVPGPYGGGEWEDDCAPGRPVYVKVERRGDSYGTVQLPVEIAFRIEPAVTSSGPPAVAASSALLPVPVETPARTVAAGLSFNDAPEIGPGTYSDAIVPGETRYWRVRLGWGQRLSYRVTVPSQPGVGIQSAALYTDIASPLRAKLEQPADNHRYALIGGTEDQTISGSSAAPVRYENREASSSSISGYSVDGDYYLVLDASYPLGRGPFTMPYRLTVATEGTVEPGPSYVGDPAASATSSPAPSPVGGSSSPAAAGGSGRSATRPAGGWVLWTAAGAVGAVVVAGAVAAGVLRRRRVS